MRSLFEVVRVRVSWFEPGDLCYEPLLLETPLIVLQPDLELEEHYTLDRDWILRAANNTLFGSIDVRIQRPLTLYTLDLFPETGLAWEVENSGWSVFERYLPDLDRLARPHRSPRFERACDPLCSLPSFWASFLTSWHYEVVCDSYGEWDSDFDLVGELDLGGSVLRVEQNELVKFFP